MKQLVKLGNVLLTNCGVSTADRIYLVKPDPGRFPDVSSSTLVFLAVLSTTDDIARLRADKAVEAGGSPLLVVAFEDRVDGILQFCEFTLATLSM